jgi:5-methyltetrahydropteroyltriglutamate--homocysteine methyltransferase
MAHLLPTQEIGSLGKPSWLLNAFRSKVEGRDLEEVRNWGLVLDIENISELIKLLKREDVDQRKEGLRKWASTMGIKLLENVGLDFVYDGEAKRVDMYEHPVRRIRGFEFKGFVRLFDNNYFRKASCIDRVGFTNPYHLDEFEFVKANTSREIKVPMTGAYTLAEMSFNEFYQKNMGYGVSKERRKEVRRHLVLDLAKEVIRPNILALVKAGAKYIQIDEPAATAQPDEVQFLVDSFNESTDGIDCKFSVHICYGDYRLLYPKVLEMKRCSQFSWEFAGRDDDKRSGYGDLSILNEYSDKKEIGLGVVDVHTDFVESPELVRDRILHAAGILKDPARLYVNPDCGLRTRSWAVAYQKLKNMVEGTALARKALA